MAFAGDGRVRNTSAAGFPDAACDCAFARASPALNNALMEERWVRTSWLTAHAATEGLRIAATAAASSRRLSCARFDKSRALRNELRQRQAVEILG